MALCYISHNQVSIVSLCLSMRFFITILLIVLIILAAGCQEADPVCPLVTQTPQYLTIPPEKLPTPTPVSEARSVVIGWRERKGVKFVEGPLCNDRWSG